MSESESENKWENVDAEAEIANLLEQADETDQPMIDNELNNTINIATDNLNNFALHSDVVHSGENQTSLITSTLDSLENSDFSLVQDDKRMCAESAGTHTHAVKVRITIELTLFFSSYPNFQFQISMGKGRNAVMNSVIEGIDTRSPVTAGKRPREKYAGDPPTNQGEIYGVNSNLALSQVRPSLTSHSSLINLSEHSAMNATAHIANAVSQPNINRFTIQPLINNFFPHATGSVHNSTARLNGKSASSHSTFFSCHFNKYISLCLEVNDSDSSDEWETRSKRKMMVGDTLQSHSHASILSTDVTGRSDFDHATSEHMNHLRQILNQLASDYLEQLVEANTERELEIAELILSNRTRLLETANERRRAGLSDGRTIDEILKCRSIRYDKERVAKGETLDIVDPDAMPSANGTQSIETLQRQASHSNLQSPSRDPRASRVNVTSPSKSNKITETYKLLVHNHFMSQRRNAHHSADIPQFYFSDRQTNSLLNSATPVYGTLSNNSPQQGSNITNSATSPQTIVDAVDSINNKRQPTAPFIFGRIDTPPHVVVTPPPVLDRQEQARIQQLNRAKEKENARRVEEARVRENVKIAEEQRLREIENLDERNKIAAAVTFFNQHTAHPINNAEMGTFARARQMNVGVALQPLNIESILPRRGLIVHPVEFPEISFSTAESTEIENKIKSVITMTYGDALDGLSNKPNYIRHYGALVLVCTSLEMMTIIMNLNNEVEDERLFRGMCNRGRKHRFMVSVYQHSTFRQFFSVSTSNHLCQVEGIAQFAHHIPVNNEYNIEPNSWILLGARASNVDNGGQARRQDRVIIEYFCRNSRDFERLFDNIDNARPRVRIYNGNTYTFRFATQRFDFAINQMQQQKFILWIPERYIEKIRSDLSMVYNMRTSDVRRLEERPRQVQY